MSTTTLLYRFVGVDAGAGAQFDRMAGKTSMLGATSSRALVGLRSLALGTAAVGAVVGVESIKMAASFQTSMLRIHTQANASNAEVAKLSKGVLAMAGSVSTTPAVLADAAYHIASVGQKSLDAAQQLNVLKLAAEGAKVGGSDLTDTTNALTATVVAGIKGAQDYSKAMGALNATVGAGDMQMQDLADALGTGVTITAKQAGISLNQMGAALAVFGDNNVRGAKAGTQLRMSIQALEKPASTGAAALAELHLSTSQLATDMQQGGLPKAITDLRAHMIAAGDTGKKIGAVLTDAFGKRAGSGIATLVGEYGRFQNKLKEVKDGSGGFASSWSGYSKSFGAALDGAKAAAESLMISLGTKLLPTATKVMNWIRTTGIPAIQSLAHWMKQNKTAVEAVAVALAAVLFPAETLGVALIVLYKRSQTFRNIVQAAIRDVGDAFTSLRETGGKALGWLKNQFAVFSAFWRSHSQQIRQVTHEVWVAIRDVVKVQWDVMMAILRPGLGLLRTIFKNTFQLIGDIVHTFFQTLADFVGLVLDIVTGKWGKAWSDAKKLVADAFKGIAKIFVDFISGAGTLLYQAGKDIISGLIHGMGSMFDSVKSTLGGLGHKIIGWKGPPSYDKVMLTPAGKMIIQGLIDGIMSKAVDVKKAAHLIALGLIGGWHDGTATLKDALSTPVQHALDKLQSVVDKAIAKQQASLKKAQTALHQLIAARKSAISSLAGSISGQADLSNLFGTDANGNPIVGNVGSFLSSQVGPLKQFAADLKWAEAHHLAPVLLSDIANLGAVQGDQVLKQFMSGQASISAANTAEGQIQRYSRAAATTVEDKVFAARIAKDQAAVKENSKALHELTQALHRVERSAAHRASTHLTIDAKSGRPKVDAHFIDEIIKGIKKAERTANRKLL